MKERGILMKDFSVQRILAGAKTQTRRLLPCPYEVGDHLWVREAWRVAAWNEENIGLNIAVDYKADGLSRREWLSCDDEDMFERLWIQSSDDAAAAGIEPDADGQYHWEPGQAPTRWRPSIFMPRWASRIILEVTNVKTERVQEISHEDCYEEGLERWKSHEAIARFGMIWDSINSKQGTSWEDNPLVRRISFKVLEALGGVTT